MKRPSSLELVAAKNIDFTAVLPNPMGMTLVQAIVLAVVEGVTEYLPVSSTGHIILTSWMFGIHQDGFVKDYTVMVQFGAIVAVVVLYWRRFVTNFKLYPAVTCAFLPAAVVGLLLKKRIDLLLESVLVVAGALIVGGFVLIWTDGWVKRRGDRMGGPEKLSSLQALRVGLFQLFAFIPGVSRSAASIFGGLHQGLGLVAATEFSFFLAVPTLTGASLIKLIKAWPDLTSEHWHILILGNVVSFIVGAAAIHTFVKFIGRRGLKIFGYYRIALGVLVVLMYLNSGA